MPYEEAQAHYEIARSLQTDHPAQALHLERARDLFTHLEAAHEMRQAPSALDT